MNRESPTNPFAVAVDTPAPKAQPPVTAAAPSVDLSEVDTTREAAEVRILWGDEVLHVAVVSPLRDVVLGEAIGGTSPDYAMSRELLGVERLAVVTVRDGQLCCVIPDGASGAVHVGDAHRTLEELAAEGKLLPYESLPGATLYPLPSAASARIEHRGMTFLVRPTTAARVIAGPGVQLRHTAWVGLSLAVHAAFLVMFYLMPERSAALSNDHLRTDTRLVQYLLDAQARTEEPPPELAATQRGETGQSGARHAGDEGQAGDPESQPTRGRMAVRGDRNDPNPELARERMRANMSNVGAIGAVRALTGSWDTPTSPFGAESPHGNDLVNAVGALFGDHAGANFGHLGHGMRGTGRGAGGDGLGTVGLASLGTIGTCDGHRCERGYGGTVSLPTRDRPTAVPRVRAVGAQVHGALSQEAIRRVVHRHLPEVRFCYEQGLQQNPSLEGRVTVSWIIGADGRVQSSGLAASSLSNGPVESCIVGAVQRWTFPSPEGGGAVGVNYPFVLQSSH